MLVEDLRAYYRAGGEVVRAVDGVHLTVRKGEILGVAGESGCGKSTLALAVTRLLQPPGYIASGSVYFNGTDLLKLGGEDLRRIRWRKISYIPQSSMNSLNPVRRVKDQFLDMFKEHGLKMDKKEAQRVIEGLLVDVGLDPRVANMYPHELSGGMKQRTIIAMAVALRPELVVADEPTTALDVVIQRGILQLILDIRNKYGTSIVLITHDISVLAEIADRIAVMYAGKIVEVGGVEEVFSEPLHPYTQALIKSVPSIKEKRKLTGLPGLPPDLKRPPPGCRFAPRCPFKTSECERKEPPVVRTNGRLVSCLLYGG